MSAPSTEIVTVSRQSILALIEAKQYAAAQADLGRLWRGSPTAATASFVVGQFEKLRQHVPLVKSRVAVLRSFTVEPVVPLVRAMGYLGGIDLTLQVGDFNTYAQEILDGGANCMSSRPMW